MKEGHSSFNVRQYFSRSCLLNGSSTLHKRPYNPRAPRAFGPSSEELISLVVLPEHHNLECASRSRHRRSKVCLGPPNNHHICLLRSCCRSTVLLCGTLLGKRADFPAAIANSLRCRHLIRNPCPPESRPNSCKSFPRKRVQSPSLTSIS